MTTCTRLEPVNHNSLPEKDTGSDSQAHNHHDVIRYDSLSSETVALPRRDQYLPSGVTEAWL